MILNNKDYNRLIFQVKQQGISYLGSSAITAMSGLLKSASVIRDHETPPDLVTMNSRLLLKRTDNDQEIELSVVYPNDTDPKTKKISVFAPLGMALLGCKEHETVNCRLPAGNVCYHICKLLYQPEAAGDLHL